MKLLGLTGRTGPESTRDISLGIKSFSSVLLIAGITVAIAVVSADSGSALRERKVDVGDGVSLRVIEAG